MGRVDRKVVDDVKKLIAKLEQKNIHIDKAYIFGSYSNGKQKKHSDIDVALISKSFQGTRFLDNKMIIDSTSGVNPLIETHPFRPEDFIADNPFVDEISRNGVEIH